MILVIGATGLVGSHLLYQLTSLGKEVIGLYRNKESIAKTREIFQMYSRDAMSKFDKIVWRHADVLNYDELRAAFDGVDEVYNCLGYISFVDSAAEQQRLINVNIYGVRNVVNVALECGVSRFCHVSSIAALGNTSDGSPIDETVDFVYSPETSYYARTKFDGEMEVWRGIAEGLSAVIVNPSVVIGAGSWGNNYAFDLLRYIEHNPKYYTSGALAFVSVEDLCRTMIILMDKGISGERYIVSNENMTFKSFFEYITILLNKPIPLCEKRGFALRMFCRFYKFRTLFRRYKNINSKILYRALTEKKAYSNKKVLGIERITFTRPTIVLKNFYQQYADYQLKRCRSSYKRL